MSALAEHHRSRRQLWALPGGRHDRLVAIARNLLPAAIGVLAALLAFTPLTSGRDISFVLAKDRVEVAHERLRVSAAQYRGQDAKGEPFTIDARSAIQATSRDPVVKLADLSAGIRLADGPARVVAGRGRYDMTNGQIFADGPVRFTAPQAFRLDTTDVVFDMNARRITSTGAVQGSTNLGRFTGSKLTADLNSRVVVIDGRAHLHIVQAAGRRR
jgi:lipopolysaccharide export system protein LptC